MSKGASPSATGPAPQGAEPLRVSGKAASPLREGDAPASRKCGGRSPKQKGYRFENECRHFFLEGGLECRRVPLSGAGEEKGDICVTTHWGDTYRFELKRRKALPEWQIKALGTHDGLIMRGDHGEAYALVRLSDLRGWMQ